MALNVIFAALGLEMPTMREFVPCRGHETLNPLNWSKTVPMKSNWTIHHKSLSIVTMRNCSVEKNEPDRHAHPFAVYWKHRNIRDSQYEAHPHRHVPLLLRCAYDFVVAYPVNGECIQSAINLSSDGVII